MWIYKYNICKITNRNYNKNKDGDKEELSMSKM